MDFIALAQSVVDNGGFSVNLKGESPKAGYMVALEGHERIVPLDRNLKHAISEYFLDNLEALEDFTGAHMGAWVNDGKVYLDISQNVMDYRKAAILGLKRKQIAIWDVTYSKEIVL